MDRRSWLKVITATGIGSMVFQRALASQAQGAAQVTSDMIRQAQWVSGLELDEQQVEELQQSLQRKQDGWEQLRKIPLDPAQGPTVHFRARTTYSSGTENRPNFEPENFERPANDQELAFCTVRQLAYLLQSRQVTSLELTRLYLERLKRFDPLLHCVVNLTEELALKQARQADAEISDGKYRGELHGIPWGAKDLMAVPGYPTTWGAPQFETQTFQQPATVYQRLTDAGAVLVAKLSLGALAMGDKWFGGLTRNPWAPESGSSGSSAGSASAVAAGLVGFAIGTETLGSILSPSRVCGTVGLRPTFGAVSRHGCMPLSWTMDKIGPIARDVDDALIILEKIQGPDGQDATVVERDYSKVARFSPQNLRVGYVQGRREAEERSELKALQEMGCQLVPVELPDQFPAYPVTTVLEVEGASVFQSWLQQNQVEGWNSWPNIFRSAHYVSAVDYLRCQRLRGILIQQMEELFDQVDVLVNANDLVITNLTGHPSLSIPQQFVDRDGRSLPRPCVLTGRYFDEYTLCRLGVALHQSFGTAEKRPPLEDDLQKLQSAAAESEAAPEAKEKTDGQ